MSNAIQFTSAALSSTVALSWTVSHSDVKALDASSMNRSALRAAVRRIFDTKIARKAMDSTITLRAVVVEAQEEIARLEAEAARLLAQVNAQVEKSAKAPRRSKWADLLTTAITQYGEDGADRVVLTQDAMEALGFSKSARTYCAYWSHNPAGRTARSLGWVPSLRKVDGEKALVLTRAA